ncbi:hypothetical protein AUC68_07540 [Methyloceanibacter methanicus]|uniref:Uncharacterized protein n=1 Tax=Methyloceanibacter methanicus TaxID=1774968 RepID=A0A1E3W1I0_9HYPH|nr:hypothetical protein [Methyloceanibacter methanicus]ODR98996.1 hypothetical protein AUC68_07540 [Methyloceanibacter methanicus]
MAEYQHTVRPRRMGGVGQFFRLRPALGLALGLACAAAVLPGSAVGQDIGLRRGEASLNAGQFQDAARQLSATVNDKDATINQVAQALYLRGIAYRRAGYPGQAAADLGAALWLGLPSSDKARAYVNKGLAFQAAGMESQGASAMAQARRYSSASTVQKLIAQDGGVGPVTSAGVASYIPSVPSPGDVWDKVVPSFGAPKTAAQPEGGAAPAENTSVWNKIVPSFGSSDTAAQGAAAPAGEAASTTAAAPRAAPTSGWDASVSEGSGGNAVSRWWGSIAGGGESTTTQTAPGQATQSAPAANTTTATRSSAASSAAAQPQATPSTGWNTSVSEGEGGSPVKQWWNSVTGSGQ